MKVSKIINSRLLFLLIFLFILLAQNGGSNIFNGIPLSNKYETLLIFIVFPFILIFNYEFLSKKLIKYLIIILFFFKIILILFSYQSGIKHKFKDENGATILSYNSFWNLNYSDIQEYDWKSKLHFPLDFVNYDNKYNSIPGEKATANNHFENLSLSSKSKTYLFVNKNKTFLLNLIGIDKSDLIIKNLITSEIDKLYLVDGENLFKLDRGIYKLDFNLNFKNKDWVFSIKNKNELFQNNEYRFMFTEEPKVNLFSLNLLIYISYIYDFTFALVFFIILLFIIFKNLFINKYFFLIPVFFLLFSYHFFNDDTNFWPIAISLILLNIFILISYWYYKFNDPRIIKEIIVNVFFVYLLYGAIIFSDSLEITYLWTAGDDWTEFHKYSRLIVLFNEWIRAGEDVYYYRPGIRYIFALLHIIFGNSSFTIQVLDLWSILLTFYLIYLILLKIEIKDYYCFILSSIFLVFIFGESFRWLIGRGLTEYFGTFIFVLLTYISFKTTITFNLKFFVICALVVLTAWLREEKFIAAFAVIFLTKNYIINKNYFYDLYIFFCKNYKIIITYTLIIFFGFPFMFIMRNYYFSGSFSALDNPVFLIFGYKSLYQILMGVDINNFPRLIPILTLPSLLLTLIAILNFKFYRYFKNIGFLIIFSLICLPTLITEIPGYIPRHTTYLLPFCLIILANTIRNKLKD